MAVEGGDKDVARLPVAVAVAVEVVVAVVVVVAAVVVAEMPDGARQHLHRGTRRGSDGKSPALTTQKQTKKKRALGRPQGAVAADAVGGVGEGGAGGGAGRRRGAAPSGSRMSCGGARRRRKVSRMRYGRSGAGCAQW